MTKIILQSSIIKVNISKLEMNRDDKSTITISQPLLHNEA